ncbi:type II toxin-antitoxin system RelE/ParE family toxin [Rickettsia hoogstraalii]|uniref:type II toxin-antitoxin system RelE/ParE family toxin n=1 Tax=Rickettsia hoogstraalii TaxID=467174 RepID=UPI000693D94D|nr:type II toxin-antitoxin system RelE/ParE family toxin [Rickettsia hoogstraalii]
MVKCDFTDSAKRDIEDIADYSLKNWGRQQTLKYLDEIYRKTLDLSINPNIGVLRSDIYPNLLSFPIRKHIIYYIKQEKGIMVIRALHTHMHPRIRNFPVPKLK